MQHYRITARLLSPLMIQENRQSNLSQSVNFIPGSSLRGSLAAKSIRLGGSPDDGEFRDLFLDNPISFPNLLPSDDTKAATQILPVTSFSCKRNPGFRKTGAHGVIDFLALKLSEKISKDNKHECHCPICGSELKKFIGFWNENLDSPNKFQPTMLYKRHTGIDRQTGTVAPTIFFTHQSIANFQKDSATGDYLPQLFIGEVYLNHQQLNHLKPLLEGSVFLGADRTRGMGEIELTLEPLPTKLDVGDIDDWNAEFKDKVSIISNVNLPDGIYFSLTLKSDAILVDQFLRPSLSLQLTFPGIETELKMVTSHTIRGWQASWGLPKPDDVAIKMGSVFLYRYTGDAFDELKDFLNELSYIGVGLRREEGFGRVTFCDSLHIVKEVI
jgi:CRISPR-associated protein Csx10